MCPDSENLSKSSSCVLNDLMDKEQDPAVLSKRKKQLENMKGGLPKEQKRNWNFERSCPLAKVVEHRLTPPAHVISAVSTE